jgi:hypothetical protein
LTDEPVIRAQSSDDQAEISTRLGPIDNYLASVPDEILGFTVEQLEKMYREEEDRRVRVEGKASSLLAAVGISVSAASGILFVALRLEYTSQNGKVGAVVGMLLAVLGLGLLSAAAAYAICALRRVTYTTPGPEDVPRCGANRVADVQRAFAMQYALAAVSNRAAVNMKVDHVHTAQTFVAYALVPFVGIAVVSVWLAASAPIQRSPEILKHRRAAKAQLARPSAAPRVPVTSGEDPH